MKRSTLVAQSLMLQSVLLAVPAIAEQSRSGAPAILARGCAGLAIMGSHFCGGLGAGWAWPQLELGVLGGYSRVRLDHIVFSPRERYMLMDSFEGTGWFALRSGSALPWRVGGALGLGRRTVTLDDFGEIYTKTTLVWSAAAGPGLGPAFILVGLTGPGFSIANASGLRFEQSIAVHVSLNVVLDLWDIGRRLRGAVAPPGAVSGASGR